MRPFLRRCDLSDLDIPSRVVLLDPEWAHGGLVLRSSVTITRIHLFYWICPQLDHVERHLCPTHRLEFAARDSKASLNAILHSFNPLFVFYSYVLSIEALAVLEKGEAFPLHSPLFTYLSLRRYVQPFPPSFSMLFFNEWMKYVWL